MYRRSKPEVAQKEATWKTEEVTTQTAALERKVDKNGITNVVV